MEATIDLKYHANAYRDAVGELFYDMMHGMAGEILTFCRDAVNKGDDVGEVLAEVDNLVEDAARTACRADDSVNDDGSFKKDVVAITVDAIWEHMEEVAGDYNPDGGAWIISGNSIQLAVAEGAA